MSYLDLAKRVLAERAATETDPGRAESTAEPPFDAHAHDAAGRPAMATETPARLDLADCIALLAEMHVEIRAAYEPGALPRALYACPGLRQRFEDTEAAIDRVAGAGPTEARFREALGAHAAVWRELLTHHRGFREAMARRRGRRRRRRRNDDHDPYA